MYGGGGGGRKGVPPVCRSRSEFFPSESPSLPFLSFVFPSFSFFGAFPPVPSLGYRTTSLPVQQRGGGERRLLRVT